MVKRDTHTDTVNKKVMRIGKRDTERYIVYTQQDGYTDEQI